MNSKKILPMLVKSVLKTFGIYLHNLHFCVIDLRMPIKKINPLIHCSIKIASKNDLNRLMKILDEKSHKIFLKSIDNGDRCYIAHNGKTVLGYSWLSLKTVQINGENIGSVPKGCGFEYNTYVFPQYRNNKIAQKFVERVALDLKRNGYKCLSNFVNVFNIPAEISCLNMGGKFHNAKIARIPLFGYTSINGFDINDAIHSI